ncbi:hypothetical protein NP196_22445 [Salmonella enterica]|uniref:Uncharacterized protein n=1 Tax=Salmonella enterica TaxID=28901 RepID=A0A732C2Q6_SALER|nr:hypothetical protein [Salmonella enterica]ELV1103322.1 hypothetical protein [Salmonella enterica]MCQ7709058.1 hypothetical protein [Salmonella enterica]MCQ7713563.1 hypothetical protein [Salmonella enterica]HAE4920538.1 hypothetical protein [Salmonella enterica]
MKEKEDKTMTPDEAMEIYKKYFNLQPQWVKDYLMKEKAKEEKSIIEESLGSDIIQAAPKKRNRL